MYRPGPGCESEHGQTVVGPSLAHSELYSPVIALSLHDREYMSVHLLLRVNTGSGTDEAQ